MTGNKRREDEVPTGLWPRVRATVRPLNDWEIPLGGHVRDYRMVEFSQFKEGMHAPDWTGYYFPLSEPALFEEFLRVFGSEGPPSDDSVIRFYARYGPLWEYCMRDGQRFPAWAERLDPERQAKLADEARLLLCEPLWWVGERAQELRLTYDLYVALKDNRLTSLAGILGTVPRGKKIIGMELVAGRLIRDIVDEKEIGKARAGSFSMERHEVNSKSPGGDMRRLTDDECRRWANVLLSTQLNAAEERSQRKWILYEPIPVASTGGERSGKPRSESLNLVRTRSVEELTTALYLHLGDLVEQVAVLRECLGCHGLFRPGRSDQEYCSARCGDAARQRGYYADRKARAGSRSEQTQGPRGHRRSSARSKKSGRPRASARKLRAESPPGR
jgi:hypothetical protein